jgi:hypothetical protein
MVILRDGTSLSLERCPSGQYPLHRRSAQHRCHQRHHHQRDEELLADQRVLQREVGEDDRHRAAGVHPDRDRPRLGR